MWGKAVGDISMGARGKNRKNKKTT
jgi:hypothetical protein